MPPSCCLIMKTIDGYFFCFCSAKAVATQRCRRHCLLQRMNTRLGFALYSGTNVRNGHMLRQRTAYCIQTLNIQHNPAILCNDLRTFMIDVYKSSKGHFHASGVMNKTLYSKQQESCLTWGEALCFWLKSPFHCETSQGEQLRNQDNKPGTSCCSRICLQVAKICFLHLWIWFSFVLRVLTVNTDTCAIFARSRAHLLVSSKTQCLLQKGKKKSSQTQICVILAGLIWAELSLADCFTLMLHRSAAHMFRLRLFKCMHGAGNPSCWQVLCCCSALCCGYLIVIVLFS